MRKIFLLILIFTFIISFTMSQENTTMLYKDPTQPIEKRVNDLISRMTLEEKVSQMNNEAKAIPRLGIPEYNWWNECLHGVAGQSNVTVFPQSIGLGATWDTDLVFRVATATSDEARALHHNALKSGKTHPGLTYWSPNINIFRDPRWGRGQETYGEDPYLTSRLGVSFVKGLQGDDPKYLKLVSTPKHFAVHSGPDPMRHRFNAKVDEKNLYETYLPHFEAVVREAHAQSIMCAYNRVNGEPCCSNSKLQNEILRNQWGFDGYIVSDCGAIDDIYQGHKMVETDVEAAARAIKNGCDLCCGATYNALVQAVKEGLVTEEDINRSLKRLMNARFKLGMFDPPEIVPYSKIPMSIVDSVEHRNLALEAARKAIVLLKNNKNILPLKKDIKTIAVIGPNANEAEVLYGNYNGSPSHAVTSLQGIKQKVSSKSEIIYAKGSGVTESDVLTPIPTEALTCETPQGTKQGLSGEYFNNKEFKGDPILTRVDSKIDFDWGDGSPASVVSTDNFTIRWKGKLTPSVTGDYELGTNTDDGIRLYLDGKLLFEDWHDHGPVINSVKVTLEANKSYDIVMEFYENGGQAVAKLVWAVPSSKDKIKQDAIQAAQKADAVILVLGITTKQENEERDRKDIDLPKVQQELMESVFAQGKPTVLVLLSGSALAINWANEHLDGIVQAWYPGEEGGTAIADILFGDYSPSGRLPVTYYKSLNQLPPFEDYDITIGRTYRYFTGEPLYPFGYGLSYTQFSYKNLKIIPDKITSEQNIEISAMVKNTGRMAGDEVVQLYLSHGKTKIRNMLMPLRSLAGFQRVHLEPGEEKQVTFTVSPKQYSVMSNWGGYLYLPGQIQVSVGGSQPDTILSKQMVKGKFTVTPGKDWVTLK